MRRILSIEAFREVTLATWDDHVDGAERLRFASPFFAESYLRRFVQDPIASDSLRALVELAPTPSLCPQKGPPAGAVVVTWFESLG